MNTFSRSGYVLFRLAADDGAVTHRQLAQELDVSTRWISQLVNALVNEGALLTEGAGRQRRVFINPQYHDDNGFRVADLGLIHRRHGQ